MKTNLLIAALVFGVLTPAIAQFKPAQDDGIVASPKFRQLLNDRSGSPAVSSMVVTVERVRPAVVASPKAVDTLANRTVVAATPIAAKNSKASCAKIAASPKALDVYAAASGCCGMTSCMIACAR